MRRFVVLATAGTLAVSAMAGCGSEPEPGTAAPSAAASPPLELTLPQVTAAFDSALKEAGSVRAALKMQDDETGEGTTGTVVLRDAGAPDHEMDVVLKSTGGAAKAGSAGGEGEQHAIMLKDADYFLDDEPTDPAKPWMKIPHRPDDPMMALAAMGVVLLRNAADLRTPLAAAALDGTLAKPAPERVGGVDTVRYTVTVADLKKAYQKIPQGEFVALQAPQVRATFEKLTGAKQAAAIAKVRKEFIAGQGKSMVLDLWVGAGGRPVKFIRAEKDVKSSGHMELTFSDWGKATITAPPAAQVDESMAGGLPTP